METKRILHLTLHRKWFDEIATGVKTEEYRTWNIYWERRLTNGFIAKHFDEIHFRNGYNLDRPFMRVECRGFHLDIYNNQFVIRLGKILEIKNWSGVVSLRHKYYKKVD